LARFWLKIMGSAKPLQYSRNQHNKINSLITKFFFLRMKTLVKSTLFAAAASMIFAACSKEQGCINKMDGEWTVTTQVFDGTTELIDTTTGGPTLVETWTFEKYNEKKDGSGAMTRTVTGFTDPADNINSTGTYYMNEDCETFNNSLPGLPLTMTITSLSSSEIKAEWTSGYTYKVTLAAK